MHTSDLNLSNQALELANEELIISRTPHRDKIVAAINNPGSKDDIALLNEALNAYTNWTSSLQQLKTTGKERIVDMVRLLNEYKDYLEVDLILERGSKFLIRQKGQMKIDNSVLEEFLIHVVRPEIIEGLPNVNYLVGPQRAFMSLAFMPHSFDSLFAKPNVVIKAKDQDFIIGANIKYSFQANVDEADAFIQSGSFAIAAMAAECKVNLDKTMFQEAAGTAARLKHGCPFTKYFLIVEYLDMTPEDIRMTSIENVFLIRKAKRLPYEKRNKIECVRAQRKENPICSEVFWNIVCEMQSTVKSVWYDPTEAMRRGSFA